MAEPTHAERYVRGLFPDRHCLLGRRLHPLCVGHLMLLHRLRNPVATIGNPLTADAVAIAQAVLICSMRWRAAVRAVNSFRSGVVLAWLAFRARHSAVVRVQLLRYLSASCDGPRWWIPAGAAGKPSAAWYWAAIHVSLCRDFHLQPDDALDMPIGQAIAMVAVAWEQDQRIELVSDEEQALLRRHPPIFTPKTPATPAASQN